MTVSITRRIGAIAMGAAGAALLFCAPAFAQTAKPHGHDHGAHSHGVSDAIYKGHFTNAQVAARPLSDWAGDWQSVYPYLRDGVLDPVMAHKAEEGDKSAADYRAYYEAGYRSDVDRITISGDKITFVRAGASATAQYVSDGFEILTYAKGNRGVRYIFRKTEGDAAAPGFIQFSDHIIAPQKSGHYHLYSGDDRAALLQEVTNWPTYYPAALDGAGIVQEMLAH